jgi:DMSO/TMAO reductase YedYZ molybdopterin-dependent catalytic subunit
MSVLRQVMSRRSALATVGVLAAIAVGVTSRRQSQQSITSRVLPDLPQVATPLAPLPIDPAATIDGLEPLVTPASDFFRIDIARSIPTIDPDTWTLTIDGMVATPVTYTYDDLRNMELIEVDATLACVSNPIGGYEIGSGRWTGIPLATLLAEAGVQPSADQVMGCSESDGFTAGFPIAEAMRPTSIVAIGLGGEPLSDEHGFPARLIVPGLYGYVSATKWLTTIRLTTFKDEQGFWIPRGWSALGPAKTGSRIDVPKQGATVPAGTTTVAGMAWAGLRGISRVEVQVDDGPWLETTLGPAINDGTWRQWWVTTALANGKRRLTVRATDGSGALQTSEIASVDPDGATGWHYSVIDVV